MANRDCLEWLRYSSMDIDASQQLYAQRINPRQRPIEIILYHCQQGAEKALKAFMVQNGQFPPKTHDLTELRLICKQWDSHFTNKRLVNHCDFLDPFGVVVRYPNYYLSLDSEHAKRGLNSAKRIYDFVCERLGLAKYYFQ